MELRRPLLQKRGRAFFLVFRRAANAEQRRFQEEAFRQGHSHAFVDRFHSVLNRQRRVGNDFLRNGLGARNQVVRRSHFVDQTNPERFLRCDQFACQDNLHRNAFADQTW